MHWLPGWRSHGDWTLSSNYKSGSNFFSFKQSLKVEFIVSITDSLDNLVTDENE